MDEKSTDDADIRYISETVEAIGEQEHRDGGPRFNSDLVGIVRNLVTASATIQSSMLTMQATVEKLVTVIDGKSFGDRTDGLVFRMARLERRQAVAIVLGGFVAARIGYVEWPTVLRVLGLAHGATP